VALEQANEETTADCKSQLQALQDTVSLLQSENTQLKEAQQQHDSDGDQAQLLHSAQQEMAQAKADMEHFQAHTIQLQANLDASKTQAMALDAELLQTKGALEDAKTELAKAAALPSSPGSSSTGVKVSEVEEVKVPEVEEVKVPVLPEVKVPEVEQEQEEEETPAVTKVKGSDDDEGDAWGDDW
jgi:chromosome segregation ATPase